MLKIIVVSGKRTVSAFVPTRNCYGAPIDLDLFADLVRNVAETMAWQALGYPQKDFLEAGNPWRELEQEAEQEGPPLTCFKCGEPGLRVLTSAIWCDACDHYDFQCTCA